MWQMYSTPFTTGGRIKDSLTSQDKDSNTHSLSCPRNYVNSSVLHHVVCRDSNLLANPPNFMLTNSSNDNMLVGPNKPTCPCRHLYAWGWECRWAATVVKAFRDTIVWGHPRASLSMVKELVAMSQSFQLACYTCKKKASCFLDPSGFWKHWLHVGISLLSIYQIWEAGFCCSTLYNEDMRTPVVYLKGSLNKWHKKSKKTIKRMCYQEDYHCGHLRLNPTREFWETNITHIRIIPDKQWTNQQLLEYCFEGTVSPGFAVHGLWMLPRCWNASFRESGVVTGNHFWCVEMTTRELWVRFLDCWLYLVAYNAASFKCGRTQGRSRLWCKLYPAPAPPPPHTQSVWPSRRNTDEGVHSGYGCSMKALANLNRKVVARTPRAPGQSLL